MTSSETNRGRTVRSALAASLFLGVLFSPLQGLAQSQQVSLTVSATVLKSARLTVLAQPATVLVTAADVDRGYVDVAASTKLDIKSNSPDGFMIEFVGRGEFVRGLRVQGLGADLQMGPEGGYVRLMSGPVRTRVFDLGFRLELSSVARPGTYAWPVQVAVTAL